MFANMVVAGKSLTLQTNLIRVRSFAALLYLCKFSPFFFCKFLFVVAIFMKILLADLMKFVGDGACL